MLDIAVRLRRAMWVDGGMRIARGAHNGPLMCLACSASECLGTTNRNASALQGGRGWAKFTEKLACTSPEARTSTSRDTPHVSCLQH